jgi:hypothetical protein
VSTNSIDELKAASDAAEERYQQTVKARKAAIADSQEALKVATKARGRYMRAVAQQAEVAGADA